jgi:hypothetical protein
MGCTGESMYVKAAGYHGMHWGIHVCEGCWVPWDALKLKCVCRASKAACCFWRKADWVTQALLAGETQQHRHEGLSLVNIHTVQHGTCSVVPEVCMESSSVVPEVCMESSSVVPEFCMESRSSAVPEVCMETSSVVPEF